MKLPCCFHGATLGTSRLPLCFHGAYRILPCCVDGVLSFMVLPWCFCGAFRERPLSFWWFFRGVVFPWGFRRAPAVLPPCMHGASVSLPWWLRGVPMMRRWHFRGLFVVTLMLTWCFQNTRSKSAVFLRLRAFFLVRQEAQGCRGGAQIASKCVLGSHVAVYGGM